MIDRSGRQQADPGEHPSGHHRAHRRHSAVCRGDDKGGVGGGRRKRGAQAIAAVPSPALAVPASLHASLMARLDRLGPAKEVAQTGAAIGREFSHALAGCGNAKAGGGTSIRRSTVSSQQVCCSDRAWLRTRLICSNMRWCRMRPTAPCCASLDVHFTPASPKLLRANSPRSPRTNLNCSHVTAPRQG